MAFCCLRHGSKHWGRTRYGAQACYSTVHWPTATFARLQMCWDCDLKLHVLGQNLAKKKIVEVCTVLTCHSRAGHRRQIPYRQVEHCFG
jgi:hypothetical protein